MVYNVSKGGKGAEIMAEKTGTRYINGIIQYHHDVTKHPNPNDFKMHAHDACELFFFIGGNASYNVEGSVYALQKHDILIMRPCETHRLQVEPDCAYERMSVHFSPSIICDNFSENWLRPFYRRGLGRMNLYRAADFSSDHYMSCINTIISCIDSGDPDERITAALISLIMEICGAFDKKDESLFCENDMDISVKFVDYINRHLFEQINLESLAAEFYISSSQLERVFKRSIGTPVWEYIIIKRLMSARNMLSDGYSAQIAAQRCGFSDYSAFYRAYKKQFGTSPKNDCKKNKKI